ncbi:hypothetical protein [Limnobacter sp.]|uniref:restriction endonuclease-related protein n=1 Tax=Limnobacter sp. TaxID=2003368 RepID=UPI00391C60EC
MIQKEWLESQKDKLCAMLGETLSWDQFAQECLIEPRALKSYRMKEGSTNYRFMSDAVVGLIEKTIENHELRSKLKLSHTTALASRRDHEEIAVRGLASMVQKVCESVFIDGRALTAVSERPGSQTGLTQEQRKIMAMISRIQIESGQEDSASQIHLLLNNCKTPFSKWLNCEAVIYNRWGNVSLLDSDSLMPTSDCIGLGKGFSNISAEFEERLFKELIEILSTHSKEKGDQHYSEVRRFVIKNPICSKKEFQNLANRSSFNLAMLIQSKFYEPIPKGFEDQEGKIEQCYHCSSLLEKTASGIFCSLKACRLSNNTLSKGRREAKDFLRTKKSIERFWVEPGLDELRLFEKLQSIGIPNVELFPFRDRTDISVKGDIGIDLKSYANPEILGQVLSASIKGLSYYREKIICIPDWRLADNPDYMKRLKAAANLEHVHFLTVSEVPLAINSLLQGEPT